MNVDQLLRRDLPVLFDGANGTEYQRRGLPPGAAPESLVLTNPALVRTVHDEYVAAGAAVIETNTFGANRIRLESSGLADNLEHINRTAVALALHSAGTEVLVAGSIGPLGALVEPYGDISATRASEVFFEQATILLDAGVSLVVIETMMSLEEARIALRAVKRAGARLVGVTMTYEPTPDGPKTAFGESPRQVASELAAEGVSFVGSNCGRGFEVMRNVGCELRAATTLPILLQPNAGIPSIEDGRLVYPESPERYGVFVTEMLELGIWWLGGCCGMTPAHIAEGRRAMERWNGTRRLA